MNGEVIKYDAGTGEVLAVIPETGTTIELYKGASKLKLKPDEQIIMLADFDETEVEIRPDEGLVYLPQAFFRDRLNRSVGIGQWALIEIQTMVKEEWLIFDGALFIRGIFVARATGEARYWEKNKGQSWASVKESAKSDCIVRCCKDLSIASKLWQPVFGRYWMEKYAVKVWNPKGGKNKDGGCNWRRKDAPAFTWEKSGTKKPEDTGGRSEPQGGESQEEQEPGSFVMPFGKDKGKPLSELTTSSIQSTIAWCKDKDAEKFSNLISECEKYLEWVKINQTAGDTNTIDMFDQTMNGKKRDQKKVAVYTIEKLQACIADHKASGNSELIGTIPCIGEVHKGFTIMQLSEQVLAEHLEFIAGECAKLSDGPQKKYVETYIEAAKLFVPLPF